MGKIVAFFEGMVDQILEILSKQFFVGKIFCKNIW